jgi:hypothetical protein
MVTGWTTEVRFTAGKRYFSLLCSVWTVSVATHSPIQWVPGTPTLGVNGRGREADRPRSYSVDIKNEVIPPLLHTSSWHSA